MKTKITLSIESHLLREAKIMAAEGGVSISEFFAQQLQQVIRQRNGRAGQAVER
jgi:metal-responsive CopG/Arc/MetJ family transcriptional regulator